MDALIAQPVGIDVLKPLQGWQGLQQAQAQTALTQQQAEGANIANQLAGLQVARKTFGLQAGGIIPDGSFGARGGSGQAQSGYLPAPGGGAVNNANGGPAGGQQANNSQLSYPGQRAQNVFGVAMPPVMFGGVMAADDPNAAFKIANENRRQVIHSAIAQAPPEEYPKVMASLYQQGYFTPQMAMEASQHPEGRSRMLLATLTPEAYQLAQQAAMGAGVRFNSQTGTTEADPTVIGAAGLKAQSTAAGSAAGELPYAGPKAAATAGGAGQYQTTDVVVPQADGTLRHVQVQTSALPNFYAANSGARPANAADLTDSNVKIDAATFGKRLVGAESGGDTAATNTSSSASGAAQFIDNTWLGLMKSERPDLVKGKTDAQILAMRNDGSSAGRALQAEMATNYATQNAGALTAAGLPVNSLTLGLAHRFGPAGVKYVIGAPQNAAIASVVSPEVMRANPDLRGQTVAQVMGNAFKHYGANSVSFGAQDTGAPGGNGAAAAGSPGVAGVGNGTAPGIGIPGNTVLTPQGAAGLGTATNQIENDQKTVSGLLAGAQAAQQQQINLTQFRNLGTNVNSGTFGEATQRVQNLLATFAPQFVQDFTKNVTGGKIDPSKAAATQEFVKQALLTYGAAEKANNPQGGLGISQMYQSAFPNLETQPAAIRDMSNLMLISQQRIIDHAQAAQQFMANQVAKGRGDPSKAAPLNQFEADFLKTNTPQVYVAATAALNGKPANEWSKMLGISEDKPSAEDKAKVAAVMGVIRRADPGASVMWFNGQRHAVGGAQ
jgi:hypothetical protein